MKSTSTVLIITQRFGQARQLPVNLSMTASLFSQQRFSLLFPRSASFSTASGQDRNFSASAESSSPLHEHHPHVIHPEYVKSLVHMNIQNSLEKYLDKVAKQLTEKIATTNTHLTEKIDATNEKIATANTHLTEKIDATNEKIATANTHLTEKIDATNEKIATTNTQLTEKIETTNAVLTTRLEALSAINTAQSDSLKSELKQLRWLLMFILAGGAVLVAGEEGIGSAARFFKKRFPSLTEDNKEPPKSAKP